MFDILDLALQVFRIYLWPLTITMCLGVIPLAIVNHFLTSWMVRLDPDAPLVEEQVFGLLRFVWTMVLLVVIEAPLASAFATSYLGKAMFLETPVIRDVVREVLPVCASGRLVPSAAARCVAGAAALGGCGSH